MAFLQKFMKRKSSSEKANKENPPNLDEEIVDKEGVVDKATADVNAATVDTEKAVAKDTASETELKRTSEVNSDSDSEGDGDGQKEALLGKMRRQLKQMTKSHERRRRRRNEALAMEEEVHELINMTARCQLHCTALDEEILNKKCELKVLQTEGPDDHEMHSHAKKSHPILYKKYNSIKGSNEAKSLLNTIRQSQRALQYLELMTYNRYLEKHHGLHNDTLKKRTNLLLKNKPKHFGHLTEALQAKKLTLKRLEPRTSSPVQDGAEANNSNEITHVTVTSSPTSPTTPPNFTFGFPMLSMPQDSVFGSGFNIERPRLPVSPLETAL